MQGFTPLRPPMACCSYSATNRITVLKTACEWAAPLGREGMDVRNRRVSSTRLEGEAIEEVRNILNGEVRLWVGTTRMVVVGLAAAAVTDGRFLLGFPSSRLSGCCGFGLGLLRPGRHLCGGHLKLLGSHRDQLSSGFWIGIWGVVVVALTTHPLGRDSIPGLRSICWAEGPGR